jgi:WD40 repeat protein
VELARLPVKNFASVFFKLSLILELDLGKRTLRLHDAFRSYFHSRLSDSRMVHDHLLKGWIDPYALANPYGWKWYGYHVSNSSQPERLRALLTDFKWLNDKLNATDVNSLLAEFKYVAQQHSLSMIESAIRLSAHILAKDKRQLASQLLGRLLANTNDDAEALRAGALGYTETTWLDPLRPSLQVAEGLLIRTLEGHSYSVTAVTLSADSQTIVSGSFDKTIKVWESDFGDCLRTLEGHSSSVISVAVSADGRTVISGSSDNTIKVWDINSGDCLRTLNGHSEAVSAVALSTDGLTLVSGSADKTIKIWDLKNFALKASFVADAAVGAVNLANTDCIIAGDQGGQIHWLRLRIPQAGRTARTER